MMRLWRTAQIAMTLAAFGLAACHSARAGEFQDGRGGNGLEGRRPQNVFTNSQTAALAKAACAGDVAKIGALVKGGADVNGRGEKGITPLVWAMTCHNTRGMTALLQQGANPNQPMEHNETPVWLAAGGSDPQLLPILLGHGGDANAYCGQCQGASALENAISYQRTANMKLLVRHGADVNFYGGALSAGERAVAFGRYDYVVYLLQHGYSHDLQGLANSILQEKDTFGRYWKGNKILYNPHWQDDKKQMQSYTYFKQALQMLAAKGFKARKIPRTIAPPPSDFQ